MAFATSRMTPPSDIATTEQVKDVYVSTSGDFDIPLAEYKTVYHLKADWCQFKAGDKIYLKSERDGWGSVLREWWDIYQPVEEDDEDDMLPPPPEEIVIDEPVKNNDSEEDDDDGYW